MTTTSQSHRKPVTMQEIADQCGVAKQTVSRIFAGHAKHNPKTVERVMRTAREMGYDPARTAAARRMSLARKGVQPLTRTAAVYFPSIAFQHAFFIRLLEGVWSATIAKGYSLALLGYQPGSPCEDELPVAVRRGDIDGVILQVSHNIFEPILARLRAEIGFGNRPVIGLLDEYEGCHAVLNDERTGAHAAMNHLLELGHRQVLHFLDPDSRDQVQRERLAGYGAACEEHGLAPNKVFHLQRWWDLDPADSAGRLRAYLGEHPEITAILAKQDPQALTIVYDVLRPMGLDVPGAVSIIGHDDTDPLPDEAGTNQLTTIRRPLARIGEEAVNLLIASSQKPDAPPRRITLPLELVVRGTTGAVR